MKSLALTSRAKVNFTVNKFGSSEVISSVIKCKSQYLSPRRNLENLDLVKLLSQLQDQSQQKYFSLQVSLSKSLTLLPQGV